LVAAYRLGDGGLTGEEAAAMDVIGELISNLERRAMVAERETMDRYVAAFLADQVGALLKCRITGVQPFGFFATVEELGGDGLVPAATLGDDYYRYDEARQSLIGDESGETYALGQRLTLRLAEADPVSGGLRFALPDAPKGAPRFEARRAQGRRGRPANIRHQSRRGR
jgi:ribonuclease R